MSDSPAGPSGKPDPSFGLIASLLNGMPALFWATSAELILTTVSGGALSDDERNANHYAGKPVQALFGTPEIGRKAEEAHRTVLQGRRGGFTAEVNGRELQAYVEPLYAADGTVAGVIGLAIDSTERLVTERALRISEQSYRSLIEEAPSAIFRSTMSGQLLQVNRAMLEMLGYDSRSEPELLMCDLPLIFTPGSFEAFRDVLAERRVVQGIESVWVRRDGRQIQVRLSGRVLYGKSGATSYVDVLAEDVTEKKQLAAQLAHAQRMQAVGQLAGGVAHDFNNLLTVIGGHVEMALGDASSSELRERLRPVKEAAQRATVLTRQLLAFSRRQLLQNKVIDINQLIGQFSGILARLIKETVSLNFAPGPDAGCVRADPHQIEQVLMNLVVNAQDAMPRGGQLNIETARLRIDPPNPGPDVPAEGEYVRIQVRDTGLGMDAETQTRIFEPFFTTKNVGEGTGLGLSMAYGIVRQSGGQITVESAPGAGTTFTIYLPAVPDAAPRGNDDTSRGAPQPRGRETILVAEDEDAVRTLVAAYLENLGYTVLGAPDGVAALSLVRKYPGKIHLCLGDIVMPRMGGRELAARLREVFPTMRVVFMSGYAGHVDTASDLEIPNALFLAKPLSMRLLAKTIREALDSSWADASTADDMPGVRAAT